MKLAVTYEDGQVFQHFGHTTQFKLFEEENGEIVGSLVISTNGSGHGALAGLLGGLGVEALICGGIGGGARDALDEEGIRVYGGVTGDVDAAVAALLKGELIFDPDVRCSHHDEHSHEGGCGSHGCGGHGCGSHGCH